MVICWTKTATRAYLIQNYRPFILFSIPTSMFTFNCFTWINSLLVIQIISYQVIPSKSDAFT